jgi:hypothetical protein
MIANGGTVVLGNAQTGVYIYVYVCTYTEMRFFWVLTFSRMCMAAPGTVGGSVTAFEGEISDLIWYNRFLSKVDIQGKMMSHVLGTNSQKSTSVEPRHGTCAWTLTFESSPYHSY